MRDLHAVGIRLTIDDVGAGYLALRTLAEVPVDAVKIHPWLADGVPADEYAASRVRHMVALAHDRGAACMVKSVETASQWRSLMNLGCDGAQGELTTAPVPAGRMWACIDAWDGSELSEPEPVSS
jgi:EAL domain-containing protein (putative c-di-GMP-specific phosphodiesterase class I)